MKRHILCLTKSRRAPIPAESIQAPTDWWGILSQKMGWKVF